MTRHASPTSCNSTGSATKSWNRRSQPGSGSAGSPATRVRTSRSRSSNSQLSTPESASPPGHDACAARQGALSAPSQKPPGRVWSLLQDITVGYGYQPWRAALWFVAFLAAGSAVYAAHPPRPLDPSSAPHFNAVAYTLDLLLPVVNLGQKFAFSPAGASSSGSPTCSSPPDGYSAPPSPAPRATCHRRWNEITATATI